MQTQSSEAIIDIQKLYEFSGNSKSIVNSILEVFLSEVPKQMETLAGLITAKNWSSVRTMAHKMKSSYAVLGANALRTILETMEYKCEANEINEQEFDHMLGEAIILNDQVIKTAQSIAAQYGE